MSAKMFSGWRRTYARATCSAVTPCFFAISVARSNRLKFRSLNHTRATSAVHPSRGLSLLYRPVKRPLAWLDQASSGICVWRYQENDLASLAVTQSSHMGSFHDANEKFGLEAAKPRNPCFSAYSLASCSLCHDQFEPPNADARPAARCRFKQLDKLAYRNVFVVAMHHVQVDRCLAETLKRFR